MTKFITMKVINLATPKAVAKCKLYFNKLASLSFLGFIDTKNIKTGSSKANGRKPRSCLGRVFNFKLGCFTKSIQFMACTNTDQSRHENSAQGLSCKLKFVRGEQKLTEENLEVVRAEFSTLS